MPWTIPVQREDQTQEENKMCYKCKKQSAVKQRKNINWYQDIRNDGMSLYLKMEGTTEEVHWIHLLHATVL